MGVYFFGWSRWLTSFFEESGAGNVACTLDGAVGIIFITVSLKKNLNASKPSNQSKGLGGNIGCRDKTLHSIERVPR